MAPDHRHQPGAEHADHRTRPAEQRAPDPTPAPDALPAPAPALLGSPRLPGRGNGPVRAAVVQRLQQTVGNRAARRLVQRRAAPAGAGPQAPVPVQRDRLADFRQDTNVGGKLNRRPPLLRTVDGLLTGYEAAAKASPEKARPYLTEIARTGQQFLQEAPLPAGGAYKLWDTAKKQRRAAVAKLVEWAKGALATYAGAKRDVVFERSDWIREQRKDPQYMAQLKSWDRLEGWPRTGRQDAILQLVKPFYYGTINAALRGQAPPDARAMEMAAQVIKAFELMDSRNGKERRESDHFPNGSQDARTLRVGERYRDNGFFFVGDSGKISGKLKMLITFTNAYFIPAEATKRLEVLGVEEPQYIMLPGTEFEYEGKEKELYRFKQVT